MLKQTKNICFDIATEYSTFGKISLQMACSSYGVMHIKRGSILNLNKNHTCPECQ